MKYGSKKKIKEEITKVKFNNSKINQKYITSKTKENKS